jgi:hypothetical protein
LGISFSHLDGPREGTAESFDATEVLLGRAPSNQIRFPADQFPTVSNRHAAVRFEKNAWWLFDLDSTNGTFINKKRVRKSALATGDVIQLGEDGPRLGVALPGDELVRTVVASSARADAPSVARRIPTRTRGPTTFGEKMKRVRGRLFIMLGGGFAVVEFVQILQQEYGWDRKYFNLALNLTIAALLTGSILAYFHGEPGRQRFTLTELFLLSLVWAISGVLVLFEFLGA